jgi:peptidoglycan/xylan/chitin deacetylase (PgdA/CDA1 family)
LPAALALTFDDGPNPDGTRRVLELLASHAVRATFFVWGERAVEHPEVVREVIEAGHSVQPHCWTHVSHWTLRPDEVREDIERVSVLLNELGALAGTLWRPPYGRTLRGATTQIAAERGVELAGWTLNPRDYNGNDAASMYQTVRSELAPTGEAVVLMHDGHRESGQFARRPDAGNTVELVRMLLADETLTFTTLSRGVEESLTDGPPQEFDRAHGDSLG